MSKAVFFDIDGTILDRQHGIAEITPRVASAMKKLSSRLAANVNLTLMLVL